MQDQQNLFIETPELLAEKRKQEIAAMLLKQLSEGAPKVEKTRILAKQPILGTLLNAGGQWLAKNDLQRADQRVGELTQSQRQKAQEEYSSATNELMGASDKNAAIAKFMASGNPMVRALAQAELKAMREAGEKEAGRVNDRTKSLIPVLGEYGMPDVAAEVGRTGQIPQGIKAPPAVPPAYGEATLPSGTVVPTVTNTNRKGQQTGSMRAPANETKISMGPEETAMDKAVGGEIPKILEKSAATIQQAAQSQQAADRILKLAQDPQVITGFGADPRRFLASAASFFNFTGPDAVSKTQAMLSHIAEQTLDASIDLKGAITEKEWPRLAQARAGEISYSPPALQELAHIARAKEHNKMILAMRQRNNVAARNEKAASVASLYPIPEVLELDFPPDLYERMGDGTVRYKGSVQALLAKAPQVAPAGGKGKLSPEETLAEIDRLERELGLKK